VLIFSKNYAVGLENVLDYKMPKKVNHETNLLLIDNFEKTQYPDYFSREVCDIENSLNLKVNSSFKFFFKNLSINTPTKLNSVESLNRLRGLTILKILLRYLVKHGNKLSSIKVLSSSLTAVNTSKSTGILFWKNIYLLTRFFFKVDSILKMGSKKINLGLDKNTHFTRDELFTNNDSSILNLILYTLKKFNFLFSFYIYKVDKNIYKNSRGKSGKYTFIWKYIAPYKRNLLIAHWLVKESRILSNKKFKDRFRTVLSNFIYNLKSTWVWRIKKFSLNYVYFNLRRSLALTYRTSTK